MQAKQTPELSAADIAGAWAIIPTPATADAGSLEAANTVDVEETTRVVEALIDSGVDGILSLGTLGECAALSWPEKQDFIKAMVDAARGRVPVFAGTTSLSTRETIQQSREAQRIGVDGVMVGPPMWNRPDTSIAVDFFRDLGEAVPGLALCVYANDAVFRYSFPPAFWAGVANVPQVVMAKTVVGANHLRNVDAARGRIRLLPIDAEYYAAARVDPTRTVAFWSSSAACGPAPVIALRDTVAKAKENGDWTAALQLHREINEALLPVIAYGDKATFEIYNVALERGRMAEAGWMRTGPHRPPYSSVPEKIAQFAREGGAAWAELQRTYSGT
jgi:trans-o-hydroxybenzylidenepyruvate hydratase-aldolase